MLVGGRMEAGKDTAGTKGSKTGESIYVGDVTKGND